MGILLSCRDLSKRYGARPLFERLTFGLFDQERTGLIGPNGTGKSTLLKIFAGLETADDGELSKRRGLRVNYLSQQDVFEQAAAGATVREELVRSLHGLGLEEYEVDIRVDEALEGSGFEPERRIDKLSGGWRKRLAILSQVLSRPDLLLLDEPTNHLDLEGVQWLERFLSQQTISFLMVTHDRRFLEAVCTRVIELHKRYERGHFSSQGNYSQFLEKREALFETQAAKEESTRNQVRREVEWLRRGPKARTTKQKARIDRAGELIQELSELEYRNAQTRSASIDFSSSDRQTKRLIEGVGLEKGFHGRRLFGPLDVHLTPGDKLGLLGGNGSGKSTFLKLLTGECQPDRGHIKRAHQLRIVTFDQHREQLDMTMPLRRALCDSGEIVSYRGQNMHVAGWAERFLFSKDQLDLSLGRLSGGEQSRVLIARLMLKPADILLLDEPTNDLDIPSLEVLETSMEDFSGALVLVTHDRYLLDRVSRRLLAFDGKGHAHYYADLDQWESRQDEDHEEAPPVEALPRKTKSSPATSATVPSNLNAKERKERRAVEALIREAEARAKKAQDALGDPTIATNAHELLARQKAVEEVQHEIEALYARWGELDARQ